ncbi:hypothetical protein QYE76_042310 [Lolium multiflorum]|uniref:CCHC-type domain-containing protein n=1 Tax=Lolium multiflorum TaxID=4521 RepID=A0AAD8TGK2_LOLMU|nr:hypothetical protein QYE76_042310 [Lolium multiflorum]
MGCPHHCPDRAQPHLQLAAPAPTHAPSTAAARAPRTRSSRPGRTPPGPIHLQPSSPHARASQASHAALEPPHAQAASPPSRCRTRSRPQATPRQAHPPAPLVQLHAPGPAARVHQATAPAASIHARASRGQTSIWPSSIPIFLHDFRSDSALKKFMTGTSGCSDIDDAIAMEMRDSTICEMSDSTICEMSDSTICELDECLHFESMSDAPSSMDDETPIMEKMYMVHEDDDITPCLLLEDEHGGRMKPTTSTTPTSYERDYKGTYMGVDDAMIPLVDMTICECLHELDDPIAIPPLPPQAARDEGIRPRRRNLEDEENMYGKLKFNMPKFKGEDDAEAYLSWALKVDKIFRIHNYSGAKKVAMASLEFEDYANTWWEQVVTLREEKGDPPIDTWEDMKEEMQARFVPTHYKTDLFNKLQKLKQGTKTVEEFFKEMELTMMRANIQESENQTIARFFNGLNYPIKRIVEFQQYSNMVELVHQASKAERQVNEDIKYSKSKQYFASKLATTTPTTSVKPTASSTPSKQPTIQSRMKQTVSSTASSKASTGPSNVTCFKCGTQGHKSFECKNTKVMITMENGDIETLSEGEYEALVQAAVANEEEMM